MRSKTHGGEKLLISYVQKGANIPTRDHRKMFSLSLNQITQRPQYSNDVSGWE